jgi:ketosteroid isomerase-like protein
MRTVTELLAANLHDVFGNHDAAQRRAMIDQVYTQDVEFTDPEGVVRGRDALEEKARDLLAKAPAEFVFADAGLRYANDSTGALAWEFGPEGAPVARGIDIITVRDGQIATLVTMFAV